MSTTYSDSYLLTDDSYRNPERGFYTHGPASDWPDGLMIGNGTVGAIVMGHPQKECLMISNEELFLPLFEQLPVLDMKLLLPELRRLLAAGRGYEANRRVFEAAKAAGYPEDFLMTDPFHPGFDLLVDLGPFDDVSDYRRGIDFETGEAFVRCTRQSGCRVLRRSFASRADGVVVLQVLTGEPTDMRVRLGARPQKMEPWEEGHTSAGTVPKGAFVQTGIQSTALGAAGETLTFRADYANAPGGWAGAATVRTGDGAIDVHGTSLSITEAMEVLVVVAIEPFDDTRDVRIDALSDKLSTLAASYDELLARHTVLHSDLFSRIQLTLGGDPTDTGDAFGATNAAERRPVEDYLEAAAGGAQDPVWLQTVFDASRYLIISSSGSLPPNLQGLWTGTWTPHWSGDYTLDANVQAAVAHYLAAGTPELMHGLFRLMDRMLDDFRENASALYGARGFFVNTRVSTHGLQQRFNFCPVPFWTAGAAWLAHYYFDYYSYTQDATFLRDRALPFMREALEFYADLLTEGADHRLHFNPSFSPENTPANGDSIATVDATMDIAAVRELAGNYRTACRILGISDPVADEWQVRLQRLPDYLANEDGALKEWSTPSLEDNYEHRHMSHLYPLYPGDEADPEEAPELYQMCRRALQMRLRHYNPEEYSGFGLYHLAMAAARSGDAVSAMDALHHLTSEFIYAGMGTSHNPGPRIFNVDAAGGIPATVLEMLVVSRRGRIELLPAAVGPLERGRVCGLRCRGSICVERMDWDAPDNRLLVTLSSSVAQEVEILAPVGMELVVSAGATGATGSTAAEARAAVPDADATAGSARPAALGRDEGSPGGSSAHADAVANANPDAVANAGVAGSYTGTQGESSRTSDRPSGRVLIHLDGTHPVMITGVAASLSGNDAAEEPTAKESRQ